ncbi:terminase large subunit [uncultured Mediterranean phage uvMED]|nr:terminase large subunit [uncultured Mediterranean phage uvMED]BAR15010.1 phage terminase large subunit [uncultured Mediterranean phage uvMED]
MTKVVIPYTPRSLQAELHAEVSKHRWSVLVLHRRAGKTVFAVNQLLRAALTNTQQNPRYGFISPTFRQSKSVAWDYVKLYAGVIPGVTFNETELRCDLPNGARITLMGSENVDAIRGIYLDGCVIDEYADCREDLLPVVVRPALSDRLGWCVILGTPRGHNHFFDIYQQAAEEKDWYGRICKASETGILPQEELDAAKVMMSDNQFEQEFECSFTAHVEGAVYGTQLQKAHEEGRITKVPYDSSFPVDTWFDLGMADASAVWFTQTIGHAVHVIDYYECRGEGIPHLVRILDEKEYDVYGTHNAPHDIEVREMSTGKTRRDTARELGLDFNVVPRIPLEDGIHATQLLLDRCWFDVHNCQRGLDALRHHHRVYDMHARNFRTKPKHDWSSHAADAFRQCGVGLETGTRSNADRPRYAQQQYNPFAQQLA